MAKDKGMHFLLEFKPDETDLAKWLHDQPNKGAYLKALIAADRAFRESGDGVGFNLDVRSHFDKQWDETFELVKAFWEAHGRLPAYNEQYKGVRIGRWLETRLRRDKDNPSRMARLNSLNVQNKWAQHYQLLQSFQATHGRLPKQTEKHEGFSLGTWLFRQRKLLESADKNALTQEQRDKLACLCIGANDWDTNFLMLQAFKNEYGRLPLYAEVYRGVRIGRWLYDQRRLLDPEMHPEHVQKFQMIGAYTDVLRHPNVKNRKL